MPEPATLIAASYLISGVTILALCIYVAVDLLIWRSRDARTKAEAEPTARKDEHT